ncbi:RNA polymerase sigma factor, sigma-70 family [Cyclobacterium xiamenense]|uniref:RNA polymerase sigma factor, sigma-70 family n=1 Tax=Cyclobacterium xiamenense TaxID=1297121 RepID=A0A1H7A4Z3_9BACT|nr:RNA polymerase sigma factor [Cyclobacterium xiamenense]SEJ60713.1 RNA polymerase sigma factor, sigma-70 family [Cyclobacterium xiamenense]
MKSEANIISFTDCDGLWLLLQKGDRKGLEGLYRAFAHELFKYGLALVYDADFIQDCIQEVFIDLWKYHDTLGKAANVKAYLFRSLSHKLYRESKKRSKWKTEALLENTLPVRLESFESEQAGIQREHYLQVKLAGSLEKLPFRQKQVIQLLFFEQFSYEEVSKMMGINLRSVYTLAWKALSSLKKLLITLGLVLHLFL